MICELVPVMLTGTLFCETCHVPPEDPNPYWHRIL
jgi:hypothetical protein